MEQLKAMKKQLTSLVQGQLTNIQAVDTKELGEAIDMIKDLEEAIYYCTIVKAMEDGEKEKKTQSMYYTPDYRIYPEYYRDMDRPYGKMYYTEGGRGGYAQNIDSMSGNSANSRINYPIEVRDYREGRSPMRRKMYMESKEMHHDKAAQMKELDHYLKELSTDITEMIQDASPDERVMLQQKLTMLADKINV